jgi:phosphoribosylanthranilate isomerase
MVKIKICGLSRACDIDAVNEALPDYIGFVFADSKRRVSHDKARELRKALDDMITPVGVFVNAKVSEIADLWHDGVISIAQLHGGESDGYIDELRAVCDAPIISTTRVTVDTIKCSQADYMLYDSAAGGSGVSFDWNILKTLREHGESKPFFLAGGINLSNIKDACGVKPYAVDVSSGVETNGFKDRVKIINLVNMVRNVD